MGPQDSIPTVTRGHILCPAVDRAAASGNRRIDWSLQSSYYMCLHSGRNLEYPDSEVDSTQKGSNSNWTPNILAKRQWRLRWRILEWKLWRQYIFSNKEKDVLETAPRWEFNVKEYLPWMTDPFRWLPLTLSSVQPPFQPQYWKQCQFSKKSTCCLRYKILSMELGFET